MGKPLISRAFARTAAAAALAGAAMVLTLGGAPAFAANTANTASLTATRPDAAYYITVHTGDVAGAGTDGTVDAWFDDANGKRSGRLTLDNGQDNFERNATDTFGPFDLNMGPPARCWVDFHPAGLFPDWYLDTVTINGTVFSAYRWFTAPGWVELRRA